MPQLSKELTFAEEREALSLVIYDALSRNLGVRASTSMYAPLISKLDWMGGDARRLGVATPSRTYEMGFRHRHVDIIFDRRGAVSYVTVAGIGVYYLSGCGSEGTHAQLTIGDSLLPGIWWDDVRLAADELTTRLEAALTAENAKKNQHRLSVAEAHNALTSRTRP